MEDKKMYICNECGKPCTFKGSVHPNEVDYPCLVHNAEWREVEEEEYQEAFDYNIIDYTPSNNTIEEDC